MKLPLWRLIAAIAVLGGMATVLTALAPVYVENYQLQQYLGELARSPGSRALPDDTLRSEVVARAHQLRLPVQSTDVQVSRPQSKLQLQTKYAVQMDFALYQVDLHFHPNASSR